MNIKHFVLSAAATAFALFAQASHAAPVDFSFEGSPAGGNAAGYVYTSGGLTATVTGWSVSGTGVLNAASIGRHGVGYGLGICSESPCGSPQHAADNDGNDEFFMIRFSQKVDPTSVTIRQFNTDGDFDYITGNLTGAQAQLQGSTVTGLLALLGGTPLTQDVGISDIASTWSLTSGFVDTLLIGARGDQNDDYFKLRGLSVSTQDVPPGTVPLPGTAALIGVAAFGLGLSRRRRD